jgi:hypothetical protein
MELEDKMNKHRFNKIARAIWVFILVVIFIIYFNNDNNPILLKLYFINMVICICLCILIILFIIFELKRPAFRITESSIVFSVNGLTKFVQQKKLIYSVRYEEIELIVVTKDSIYIRIKNPTKTISLDRNDFDNFEMVIVNILEIAKMHMITIHDRRVV